MHRERPAAHRAVFDIFLVLDREVHAEANRLPAVRASDVCGGFEHVQG
jgi:hypothetical protein